MRIENVCVIIPTHSAEKTIGEAVRSALLQKEVSQVIVVDDCSTDGSIAAANQSAQGDPRLTIIPLDNNGGPANARNIALDMCEADYVALLDSDDVFVPNRFLKIACDGPFDLVADNIAFARDDLIFDEEFFEGLAKGNNAQNSMTLTGMIEGNISRPGKPRSELGFLKPVMSYKFIRAHGLRYNTSLRLGEDFDLYLRMLAIGAVFLTSNNVGYVARIRHDSLSGAHSGKDLGALYDAIYDAKNNFALCPNAQAALEIYLLQLHARYLIHRFLEIKNTEGYIRALAFSANPPSRFFPIAKAIFHDKLMSCKYSSQTPDIRYLFDT
ncbi:glycosyltransferase family 2 protein [Donghicola mangrovi]|nr:glycosyltransferase family 2 protein [Donghicola mangrovi]